MQYTSKWQPLMAIAFKLKKTQRRNDKKITGKKNQRIKKETDR